MTSAIYVLLPFALVACACGTFAGYFWAKARQLEAENERLWDALYEADADESCATVSQLRAVPSPDDEAG